MRDPQQDHDRDRDQGSLALVRHRIGVGVGALTSLSPLSLSQRDVAMFAVRDSMQPVGVAGRRPLLPARHCAGRAP